MTERTAATETRRYGRSAGLLTIAFGSAGLLVYIYFALASHNLTADQYGDVVVLWSAVYVIALTLFRPTEQLLSRSIAEAGTAGGVLRVAAAIQLGVAALALIAAFALRGPLEDDLLSGNATAFAVLAAALAGFAASYYARGFLAGARRFTLYAALLVAEGTIRLGFALAYATGITDDADVVLIAIAAAPLLSLAVVPFVIGRTVAAPAARGPIAGSSPAVAGTDPEFTLARGSGFAAAVLLMMFSEQVIVSSGALFVRAAEGAAAAGFIFNVLMVARAPLVLFQAIAASLLPHLTRLRARGGESGGEAFRQSVGTTLLAIAAFASAVTLGVLAIGPELMQIAFGEKFEYDRLGLVIVAVGMGFYLAAATLNQAALAQGQAHRAAIGWIVCAALFAVINLLPGIDEIRRVEIGFTTVAILLCGFLYAIYRRPHPRADDLFTPDSAREIEARLAATDEIA